MLSAVSLSIKCACRGEGDYNGSTYNLKPDFATSRLRKCGAHCLGPRPIFSLSRWFPCPCPDVVASRKFALRLGARRSSEVCVWRRRGQGAEGADCSQVDLLIPTPSPDPAPRPPARRALVPRAVSPRALGRGRRPAAVPLQRAARSGCDRGFSAAWVPGPASAPQPGQQGPQCPR